MCDVVEVVAIVQLVATQENTRKGAQLATQYLSIKAAIKFFSTNPTPRTVLRWMKRGVHDRRVPNTTNRIKLQSICEGAYPVTTIEWIRQFQEACENNVKEQKR